MDDHDPLLRHLADQLDRESLLHPGDRLAVAVSGGADSLALLLLLARLAAPRGIQLSVVHFDHRWRASSSDDAAFVRSLAAQLHLPFHLGVAPAAPTHDREQHARRQRYAWFVSLITAGEVDLVATAHTADDQAETVLLRLLRGSALSGLAGILPRRSDGIIRPLLAFSRTELRAWLVAQRQTWREDQTNLDLHHARNLLRARFLPALSAAFNPALTSHLAALADVARAEEAFWDDYLLSLWTRLWHPTPTGGAIPRADLLALPLAVQRRLLRRVVLELQGGVRGLNTLALQEILDWAASPDRHPRRRRLARCECVVRARELQFTLVRKV